MGGGLLGRMPVTQRANLASRGAGRASSVLRGNMRVLDDLGNVAGRARASWCWLAAMGLFGQAGLAQPLGDPLQLLLVLRTRQCKWDRRKPAERRYPGVGASFQIGGELCPRLVGATEQRVDRRQESVG